MAKKMDQAFVSRLKKLIGNDSVSQFARQVGLGESLIRKYLTGSEPSLSKLQQICDHTQADLSWLVGAHDDLQTIVKRINPIFMQRAINKAKTYEQSGVSYEQRLLVIYQALQQGIENVDEQLDAFFYVE